MPIPHKFEEEKNLGEKKFEKKEMTETVEVNHGKKQKVSSKFPKKCIVCKRDFKISILKLTCDICENSMCSCCCGVDIFGNRNENVCKKCQAIGVFCCNECGEFMGLCNPRQLCGKTKCYNQDKIDTQFKDMMQIIEIEERKKIF